MISAGHHTMMKELVPTTFRYVGIKIAAIKAMRNSSSLSYYNNSASDAYTQISEIQFQTSTGTRFGYPSDFQICSRLMFNGVKFYQGWVSATSSTMASGENAGQLFDNSTSTKMCKNESITLIRNLSTWEPVRNESTDAIVHQSGDGMTSAQVTEMFGSSKPTPIALIIDLATTPLDISTYGQWRFNNANDNATHQPRTWVEGEILGSTDLRNWWRLDVFNNSSMPTTNYAVAYTGNLVPRKGDLWSNLDLSTRDWTNGIAVDNI